MKLSNLVQGILAGLALLGSSVVVPRPAAHAQGATALPTPTQLAALSSTALTAAGPFSLIGVERDYGQNFDSAGARVWWDEKVTYHFSGSLVERIGTVTTVDPFWTGAKILDEHSIFTANEYYAWDPAGKRWHVSPETAAASSERASLIPLHPGTQEFGAHFALTTTITNGYSLMLDGHQSDGLNFLQQQPQGSSTGTIYVLDNSHRPYSVVWTGDYSAGTCLFDYTHHFTITMPAGATAT
jgi:hypothetical protein